MSASDRLLRLSRKPGIGKLAYALLKLLGVEFPRCVPFGRGVSLPHNAVGLVVHESTIIGNNVVLFQGVTLGRADQAVRCNLGGGIVVGDDAVICAGAKVLFKSGKTLRIGARATIGANAVVLSDVGEDEVWVGVPAKRISSGPMERGQVH